MILFAGLCVFFLPNADYPGNIIVLIVSVLIWSMLQFSRSYLTFNPSANRFRIEHRLYNLFPFGRWINVADVEAYYARPALVASRISRGMIGTIAFQEDIRYKSWLVEIKLHSDRSYRPLFEVNKARVQKIVEEIFDPTGIEFKRIIPKGSLTKKRRR